MPSRLRNQISFEPTSAETARTHTPSPPSSPSALQKKMSLSQTYYVAASARQKLGKEASRADHDLRLLVGHANLLDSLMLDLADAEKQQESWFNQTVRKASQADEEDSDEEMEEPRHIRWADTITEEDDEDSDSDSDSDSEFDEDEMMNIAAPVQRLVSYSTKPRIVTTEIDVEDIEYEMDSDDEDYEDEEDDEEHALVRVASQSPPELIHDDDSDDESQPPSPPQPVLDFSQQSFFTTGKNSLVQSDKAMDQLFTESRAPLVASY